MGGAGEDVFTLDLDGELLVKASSTAVGFQWCQTGSEPALGVF